MRQEAFEPIGCSQKDAYVYANYVVDHFNFKPLDNIEEIVKKLGGTLEYVDDEKYESTEDGSIVVNGKREFSIFVSKTNSHTRKRFTIAHEIGHYILHSKLGEIKGKAQRFPAIQQYSQIEVEANWFAAGFLMPISSFKDTHNDGLFSNAIRFGVSLETAEYRYLTFKNKEF